MESSTASLSIVALSAAFVSERRYLQNVSPKTLEWYKCSFKAFEPYLSGVAIKMNFGAPCGRPSSPTSINDYARCMNAFLKWLVEEEHVSEHIKIPRIKTAEKVSPLLSDGQVGALIRCKPRNRIERRVHTMALAHVCHTRL